MSLNTKLITLDVQRALHEDIGTGDITAALLQPSQHVSAQIISREPMVVCGIPWVNAVWHEVNPSIQVTWHVKEGDVLSSPTCLCSINGPADSILTGERTALNFLQTLSATATQTHEYVEIIQEYKTKILDTRKTLPGLRYAQKYAVKIGGGVNHRMGLYDAFLIKENHIKAYGSIANVIKAARKANPDVLLEIEVETLDELKEALMAKPNRIMLDNFSYDMLIQAVKMNEPKQCDLEVSGGVSKERLLEIAKTNVDFISIGALTKSIQAIDLSLLLRDA